MTRTAHLSILSALVLLAPIACANTGDPNGPDDDFDPDPVAQCGDGVVDDGEQCDDGNTEDGDGCDSACAEEVAATARCGDGVVEDGEQCDDGNTDAGDGCDASCQNEVPTGPTCGDGVVEGDEQCDDGNLDAGDGCAADCTTEEEVFEAQLCVPAYEVPCNTIDTWSTTELGSTDQVDGYQCSAWDESGREYTYKFVAPTVSNVTFTLSNMTADLDVFVLDGNGTPMEQTAGEPGECASDRCLDSGEDSVTIETVAGATYYVVVDGYAGAEGDYSLTTLCGACGDGNVDPGETCDDGNTDAGDGCDAGCQAEPMACEVDAIAGCNVFDQWGTDMPGATDRVDSYACTAFDQSGPEYTYEFVADETTTVTVTLDPETGVDLDLFVIDENGNPAQGQPSGACDPDTCILYGNNQVTFDVFEGETYSIVVDGYNGAVGSYYIDFVCGDGS